MTSAGAHAHGGATAGHALSVAQMPPHAHGGSTGAAGSHFHTATFRGTDFGNQAGSSGNGIAEETRTTSTAPDHSHGISVEGGGQAHSHGISSDGDHTHTVASAGGHSHSATVTAFRPPYFVVNFIVKKG
jgi:hypothetical protein